MSTTCGVCSEQPPKYKCPSCAIRYCSLACFKTHKPIHDNPAAETSAPDSPSQSASSAPTASHDGPTTAPAAPATAPQPPQQHAPADLQRLLTDPALLALLQKNPALRTRLHAIYTSTLEPSPEAWAAQQNAAAAHHRGRGGFRGRGRGGRGRGRGGGSGGDRPRGPWKQELADRSAVNQILRVQEWEGEGGEDVREFLALVQRSAGGQQVGGGVGGDGAFVAG
ncbi:hypothetical protein GTA08_BOTSDO00506 [Neofusicoccum parvum]|uniref:Uncharacterized protein n=1 Tax=Neofusicoccum parvum TaxID=310453 RepID=A0ACB5SN29_9PEZI|nr:hypothetical protein GTA08_BOTSDO00506 [Neofusicoccum parvum]